jgi:hypothetical protein
LDGIYAVNGGAGDDTIDLPLGLFNDLRVDGGAGFDTMIMHHPREAGFGRYAIDFNAGAFGSEPAIQDMIKSVEHFVFDGGELGFDATMSASSIKAMTSSVTNYQAPFLGTIASTSLMYVDGVHGATLTLSDAIDWTPLGQQAQHGETYDVLYNQSQNVFLLTHGFDHVLS